MFKLIKFCNTKIPPLFKKKSLFHASLAISSAYVYTKMQPMQTAFASDVQLNASSELVWEVSKKEHVVKHRSFVTNFFKAFIKLFDINYLINGVISGWNIIHRSLQILYVFSPALVSIPRAIRSEDYRKIWWKTFVDSIERAGPCFIKFGQWGATRPDLFPPDLCNEMKRLQSKSKSHTYEFTEKSIHRSFGEKYSEMFESVEKQPLGSGCIAQVHKAVLREDWMKKNGITDKYVAIKVLHPDITNKVNSDLKIMTFFVNLLNWIPNMHYMSFSEIVQEFSVTMNKQLDMTIEAKNLEKFRQNFSDSSLNVIFPKPIVYDKNILVEEYMEGIPLNQVIESDDQEIKKSVAKVGMRAFLKMLLQDNFVHADMHSGNALVQVREKDEKGLLSSKKKKDYSLILFDVGLVAEMKEEEIYNFAALFDCLRRGDGVQASRLMLEGAKSSDCKDPKRYQQEMQKVFDLVKDSSFSEIPLGHALTEVMNIVRRHKVKIESEYSTLMVSIIIVEGIAKQLDSSLHLFSNTIFFSFVPQIIALNKRSKEYHDRIRQAKLKQQKEN